MDQQMMQALEMKMQMKTQNQLLNSCFGDCVQSFREDSLTGGEKSCLQHCAGRALIQWNFSVLLPSKPKEEGAWDNSEFSTTLLDYCHNILNKSIKSTAVEPGFRVRSVGHTRTLFKSSL